MSEPDAGSAPAPAAPSDAAQAPAGGEPASGTAPVVTDMTTDSLTDIS